MADEMEGLKIVGEIGSLSLRPDDVLVVRADRRLSDETIHRISAAMKAAFPDHKTMVLDEGMAIEIARKELVVAGHA